MQRWKSDREDEFFYLKILLGLAVLVAIVAGLIEWNARRQAAAMTRELLRPATPEEQAQIEQYQRNAEAEMAALKREMWGAPQQSGASRKKRVDGRPLASDERCISGQRFRRLENGWQEVGTCRG